MVLFVVLVVFDVDTVVLVVVFVVELVLVSDMV